MTVDSVLMESPPPPLAAAVVVHEKVGLWNYSMISDTQVFTILFIALITGILASRLGAALYQ